MIVSIIQTLVNQLSTNGISFGFGLGAQYWANLAEDEFDFGDFQAIVYLDQPITTDYQLTAGGYIGEFYPITLFFMFKSELEWLPEEHDSKCIEPANIAIRQFISICQSRNDLIDEVSDPSALEFTNLLDVNVSGKSLSIKLKPRINVPVCVPPFTPIPPPIIPSGVLYKRVNFTAMTTSYRTGDDAYNRINNPFSVRPPNPLLVAELDYTSVTPFLTLLDNNAFGTKERFTNSLGLTASYDGSGGELIDYVIDHLTGLGWIIKQQAFVLWDVAIDTPLSATYVGFTDFKLPNIEQQISIYNYAVRLNYAPFSISTTWLLWSSTTRFDFPTNANYLDHTGRVQNADKAGFSFRFMVCRNHY